MDTKFEKYNTNDVDVESVKLIKSLEYKSNENICKIHYVHVKVNNLKQKSEAMLEQFCNETWLFKLEDEGDYSSFKVSSESTLRMLKKILDITDNKIGKEFGEYLISSTALATLEKELNHETLPLAEIWRDQESKNPGFDFHSLSPNQILLFGEAKYRAKTNAYGPAINSICDFILRKKDIAELVYLKRINKRINNEHLDISKKGFIAAFSIYNNFENIFTTIMENKLIKELDLFKYPEWYFIGVEICP